MGAGQLDYYRSLQDAQPAADEFQNLHDAIAALR